MNLGSTSSLRRRNRDVVLRAIASRGPVSRTQIARHTGLTGAAVSRITRELIDVGLVQEAGEILAKGQVGRRNIQLVLGGAGAFVVGIALAANVRSVSIGDSRGDIIVRETVKDLDLGNPKKVVARLSKAADRLITRSGIDRGRIVGCGISVAGTADPERGELVHSEPLGWSRVPLARLFEQSSGLAVRMEGRAVALLLAERWRGLAKDKRDVVLINNGISLGGSIMTDGHILRGRANRAGQLTHMAIHGDRTRCACGRLGCLDAIASGAAIINRLQGVSLPEKGRAREPGDRLRALADYDGPDRAGVSRAFRDAGKKLGFAVDNICAFADPELVLLAGEAGRHPKYIEGVRTTLARLQGGEGCCPVMASRVSSDQSAIWLGLNAFVYSQSLDIERLRVA